MPGKFRDLGGGDGTLWRLAGAGLLGALAEAAGVALMATATWLLVTAAGQPPLTALTVAIVSVRALAISRAGLRYLERLAGHDTVLRIVTQIRTRIFAGLIDRPPVRHADALSRMVSDVDATQDLVIRVGLPIFANGLICAVAAGAAIAIDPAAGLVIAAGLVLTGLILPVLGARLTHESAAKLAPLRAAHAIATVDVVHGAADLAAYGATARYESAGNACAHRLSTVERRLARRSVSLDAASSAICGLTAAAVLLVSAQTAVWTAVLVVGTLALGELGLNLLAAARKGAEISSSLARVRELTTAAKIPELAWQSSTGSEPNRAFARQVPERLGVRLEGVGVNGRLEGIDLDLPPGRKVAVIGHSGAGKSTLLAVIAGMIEPDQGIVTREGAGVATGLMADAHLFHTSIRENLRLGNPEAADAELIAVAGIAGIDLSTRYPMEDLVGENGAELSGGERQRLCLARALLARPYVLLLDEPTEGLDPAHATAVLGAVMDHARDRTVVLVTHRLTGLDRLGLDEVLVLDSGRIVDRGSPGELVAREGWMRAQSL